MVVLQALILVHTTRAKMGAYTVMLISARTQLQNYFLHDPHSPLLFGNITDVDVIKVREVKSCKDCQMNLFD